MTASQIDFRDLEPNDRRISPSPPPPQHGSGPPITGFLSESAADEWKATASRVQAVLQHRGVEPHTAEDLVQEVALRILNRGERFNDAAHRERWALTVAWRLAKNRWRDDGHLRFGDVPDRFAGRDPADVVVARESLERVVDAFRGMDEKDQEAVILGFDPVGQPGAVVVRRHRARVHLARVRATVGVAVARMRERIEALLDPIVPALVSGAIVFAPVLGATGEPARVEVRPDAEAPSDNTGAAPAAPLPTVVDDLGVVVGRRRSAPPLTPSTEAASMQPADTAVVPGHNRLVGVSMEPEPRPRPLVCVGEACLEHPARGVVTP